MEVSKTSGLAGIAYWINGHYHLTGDKELAKNDPLVVALKAWVDEQYEQERQTVMSTMELEEKIEENQAAQAAAGSDYVNGIIIPVDGGYSAFGGV